MKYLVTGVSLGLAVLAEASLMSTHKKGMLTTQTLRISDNSPEGARLFLGRRSEYSVGTDTAGNFLIRGPHTAFLEVDTEDTLRLGSKRVETSDLYVSAGLSINGVKQWQMAHQEDFSSRAAGWSRQEVTQCGGVNMLGGFCKLSSGEVNKTFSDLPAHKQLRITATYHFIDRWVGESGYLKLNVGKESKHVVVWSEQHSQEFGKNGLSLCGQSETPEGKFSAAIDVTVPHTENSVEVAFGSTMDDSDPCDESWGVSGLELHVRQ